jgi:hypothetical protein
MEKFDDSFEYAQARKKAAKMFEYNLLKEKIQKQELGYEDDVDVVAWARYYTLADELKKNPELF